MDSMSAFMMGEINRGKELMVFDWEKAARILKETGATSASAGLRGDWEWTGGDIFVDGMRVAEREAYLASTWAVPELEINGRRIECFRMQSESPGWNAKTHWPKEAIDILEAA